MHRYLALVIFVLFAGGSEAEPCGALTGLPACSPDYFCQFAPGYCRTAYAVGTCQLKPTSCTREYRPVCGCDGLTYATDCMRRAAGVQLDYYGECKQTQAGPEFGKTCGTIAGIPCSEGQFCQLASGQCQAVDAGGICEVNPVLCPRVSQPVCGCDGKTYNNDCMRQKASVSKDHDGSCREVISQEEVQPQGKTCGTIAGIPCSEGQFCQLASGQCQAVDAGGFCKVTPIVCPRVSQPVCGCDGKTYDNDCLRQKASVSKDHDGSCQEVSSQEEVQPQGKMCGTIAGIQCVTGQFCEFATGKCHIPDFDGTCTAKPEACTLEFRPVCGCDGKTYGNECMRRTAGISKLYDGECKQ